MMEVSFRIEDEIRTALDARLRQEALAFSAYLNANAMTPERWFGPGFWRIPWENNYLCGIHFYGLNPSAHQNGWVFWFFAGDYDVEAGDAQTQFVWEHVGPCVACSEGCERQGGIDMRFFGRQFRHVCYQFPVRIENPDAEALEQIKELLQLWKEMAPHSDGLHVH